MAKIQVELKSCSFHRRNRWWNSFCPTRLLLARRAKNVSKIVPRREVTKSDREVTKSDREVTKSDREVTKALVFCARWPSPWHYFRDIFGSPGQEEPSWAKWVSPSISSMKTTTFKPNLYFCHRITTVCRAFVGNILIGSQYIVPTNKNNADRFCLQALFWRKPWDTNMAARSIVFYFIFGPQMESWPVGALSGKCLAGEIFFFNIIKIACETSVLCCLQKALPL